jgi:hypothetical protein
LPVCARPSRHHDDCSRNNLTGSIFVDPKWMACLPIAALTRISMTDHQANAEAWQLRDSGKQLIGITRELVRCMQVSEGHGAVAGDLARRWLPSAQRLGRPGGSRAFRPFERSIAPAQHHPAETLPGRGSGMGGTSIDRPHQPAPLPGRWQLPFPVDPSAAGKGAISPLDLPGTP